MKKLIAIIFIISLFNACKKDDVNPTEPPTAIPDSIRFVVTDAGHGCKITYTGEDGLPKDHNPVNAKSFDFKVKAVKGIEFILYTQNSEQTTASIYLNDSLATTQNSSAPSNESWQSFKYK